MSRPDCTDCRKRQADGWSNTNRQSQFAGHYQQKETAGSERCQENGHGGQNPNFERMFHGAPSWKAHLSLREEAVFPLGL